MLLQKPELPDVYRLTLPISSNWNRIGSELRVSFNFRKGLKSNNQSNDDRLEDVLHQWLQSATTPPTWLQFLSALEKAEMNEVVQKVRDFLKTLEFNERL